MYQIKRRIRFIPERISDKGKNSFQQEPDLYVSV